MRGMGWQMATRGTFEVSKMAVAMVLARLLTPHEYGIAGMVLVVVAFEPALSGVGLASSLVQRSVITEQDKSTAFWTIAGIGLLVTLTGIAISGLVAQFYGDPQVGPLFAAMSFVFLLSSLSAVHVHLLVREMDFRSLELRSMAGVVVGAVAAIVVAAEGGGPWALVAQQLAFFGTSLVLLWAFSGWHPKLMYSRQSWRELRGFGRNVSGTLLMFQLTQNTDNVLIGRFLGASALGPYALGYNIILLPFSRIAAPLHLVLYPVFSRVKHDLRRLSSLWLRVLRMMAAVAMPAMLGLVVVAPEMVDVVFGHRWHEATPIIQILSVVGLVFGLQGLNSVVLQAIDRTRLLFRYASVSFAASVVSFVVGLHWGIVGVASCFAAISLLIQPIYLHLTARAIGIGLRQCVAALSGVMQATVVATAAAFFTRELLVAHGVAPSARLIATIAVGAIVYVPVLAWRAHDVVREVWQLRVRRGATPAARGAAV